MKSIIVVILSMFLFTSCNNSNSFKQAYSKNASPFDSSSIFIDSAESLLSEANNYVEEGIKGQMKKSKVNKEIRPLMEKYFSIYKRLKPEDTLIVHKFRLDKINELIDLQMKYHK